MGFILVQSPERKTIEHSNKRKDKTNALKRPTGLKKLMQTPFMSKKFQNFL